MKHILFAAALAVALVGCSKSAPNASSAGAKSATEVDCTEVPVQHKKEWGTGGVVGTAVGGALGGLVGNQFGGGSGKTALTAAGAVGGAVAGHEVGKNADTTTSYEKHCHRVSK